MGVISIGQGEDSLFDALAYFDGYDGKALRIDVANFMEMQAVNQPNHEESELWLQEVCQLRANMPGTYAAILAYSLMKSRRVLVHAIRASEGAFAIIQEASHPMIYGKEGAQEVHLLYSEAGHFDALVDLANSTLANALSTASLTRPGPGPAFGAPLENTQQLELSSLFAPIATYSRAHIASWTSSGSEGVLAEEEHEELLRLAGWLLQLHCMPPPKTQQFRAALRTWQDMLRRRLGGRRLPWPWSFMVHGMIL